MSKYKGDKMISLSIAAAVGYIAGAFTPAIGRKIKALFVKEAAVVKADVAKKV